MKTIVLCAAFISIAGVSSAVAATYVVKFQYADQTSLNATFDDVAMTFKNDKGQVGKYTFDAGSKELCGVDAAGVSSCVTLGGKLDNVGDAVSFTSKDGRGGTATLTAKN